MANTTNDAVLLSAVPVQNTCLQTDTLLIVSNTNIMQAPLANAFSNVTVTFNGVVIVTNTTPANSVASNNVVVGSMWSDGSFIYIGCSNNVIKRASLSTW